MSWAGEESAVTTIVAVPLGPSRRQDHNYGRGKGSAALSALLTAAPREGTGWVPSREDCESADKPSSVPRLSRPKPTRARGGNHPSSTPVARRLKRPYPGTGRASRRPPIRSCSGWGLPSQPVSRLLASSYLAVSPLPALSRLGRVLSVALSFGLPRPGVTRHRALRSSDFPRQDRFPPRLPGGLAPRFYPRPGSTDRTTQIGMRGVPSRSPDLPVGRSRSGCGACRAEGGDEHVRERIRRCVTERAQETTPGSAASAPEMPARSGGSGLSSRLPQPGIGWPIMAHPARFGDSG
jgi:hypothetical protein